MGAERFATVRIGDIAAVKGGKRLPKGKTVQDEPTPHPYIRVTDFGDDGLDASAVKYIDEDTYSAIHRYTIASDDVYISIAGTIGRVGIVPAHLSGANLTENAAKITGLDPRVNTHFLMYCLREYRAQAQIAALTGGASQPKLALYKVKLIEVPLPPLPTQRKIAAILSAYDDLIENNTRRIAILEEMARLIYREWFVHFHFPGHEDVTMVDSELGPMPEEWEVVRLAQVAEVVDCLHSKKPARVDDGNGILLHVWNVDAQGQLDLSEQYRVSEQDYRLWTKRIEVASGDCVMTKTGRVGAVGRVPLGLRAAIGRNLVAIRWPVAPSFLHQYLLSSQKGNEVTRLKASGTIMESLHVKAIERLRVAKPPMGIIEQFESVAGPLQRLSEILRNENQHLRSTRDLLLPRLVSGELDVSELDMNAEGISH
jgi:type I restriction enzyme S subunit